MKPMHSNRTPSQVKWSTILHPLQQAEVSDWQQQQQQQQQQQRVRAVLWTAHLLPWPPWEEQGEGAGEDTGMALAAHVAVVVAAAAACSLGLCRG
jgi:hypothetical protein